MFVVAFRKSGVIEYKHRFLKEINTAWNAKDRYPISSPDAEVY
jgi:hypothetical protein